MSWKRKNPRDCGEVAGLHRGSEREHSPRGLHYTHERAADEIDTRLRRICFGEEDTYYEVTTIHSFALQNVLRPFHKLLPEFRNGYEILAPDCDLYVEKARELIAKYDLKAWVFDEFERIQRSPNGGLPKVETLPTTLQSEWCDWLDCNALVTLNDIVYHAGRLASSFPYISSALASRFEWILVDEFQDSSPGQILLLRTIHEHARTTFFCVGDPNQSIYRFAGASPELLTDFADHVGANVNHRLTGNFRSSAQIVAVAEQLCASTPPMKAVGDYADFPNKPTHHVATTAAEAVFTHFLPAVRELYVPLGEVAILAPWWVSLFHLARQLRKDGIPAVGPGARPYKRSHILAQLAEPIGAYLESPEPEIALAVQRALFILIANTTDHATYGVYDFPGRLVVCKLLAEAAAARAISARATEWLIEAAARFGQVLTDAEFLPEAATKLLRESADQMAKDILSRDGGAALTIEDLGIFARPKHCVQLLTVHKAKGREFEAVAVIDAHDGRFPHFSCYDITDQDEFQAQYDESRRVVYVAATRAKRLLMFFTDTTHPKNKPTPFLMEMGLV
jgi:DNA helicase-2/ATP-dependent DNA helicase PcrA